MLLDIKSVLKIDNVQINSKRDIFVFKELFIY